MSNSRIYFMETNKLKLIKSYLHKKDRYYAELINLNKYNSKRKKQIIDAIKDLNIIISNIFDETEDIFHLNLNIEEVENEVISFCCLYNEEK
jgi:hypothetical protein